MAKIIFMLFPFLGRAKTTTLSMIPCLTPLQRVRHSFFDIWMAPYPIRHHHLLHLPPQLTHQLCIASEGGKPQTQQLCRLGIHALRELGQLRRLGLDPLVLDGRAGCAAGGRRELRDENVQGDGHAAGEGEDLEGEQMWWEEARKEQ